MSSTDKPCRTSSRSPSHTGPRRAYRLASPPSPRLISPRLASPHLPARNAMARHRPAAADWLRVAARSRRSRRPGRSRPWAVPYEVRGHNMAVSMPAPATTRHDARLVGVPAQLRHRLEVRCTCCGPRLALERARRRRTIDGANSGAAPRSAAAAERPPTLTARYKRRARAAGCGVQAAGCSEGASPRAASSVAPLASPGRSLSRAAARQVSSLQRERATDLRCSCARLHSSAQRSPAGASGGVTDHGFVRPHRNRTFS